MADTVINNNTNENESDRRAELKMKRIIDKTVSNALETKRMILFEPSELKAICALQDYFVSKIKDDTTIKVLCITRSRIRQNFGSVIWNEFDRIFSNLKGLEEVGVCDSRRFYEIDNETGPGAVQMLQVLLTNSIHTISVKQSMSVEDVRDLCTLIYKHPTLTTVNIDDRQCDGDLDNLLDTLTSIPNLKDLSIPFKRRMSGILLERLIAIDTLRELKIVGYDIVIEEDEEEDTVYGFQEHHLRGISSGLNQRSTSLSLSFTNIVIPSEVNDLFVSATMEQSNVNSIHLKVDEQIHVDNFDVDLLPRRIGDGLRSNAVAVPDLHINSLITNINCTPILEGIEQNQTIQNVTLDFVYFDEAFYTSLSHILQDHPSITILDVRGHPPGDSESGSLCACLSEIQRFTPTLKKLALVDQSIESTIQLHPERYYRIMELVAQNTTLKEITLPFYGRPQEFSFPNFIQGVSSLQRNSSLETLGLTEPFILSDEQLTQFVNVAKLNYSILSYDCMRFYKPSTTARREEHDTTELDIEEHDTTELDIICKLNKAGRRYLLEEMQCHKKGVHVLIGVKDDLDALYMHLLENPDLCNVTTTTNITNNNNNNSNNAEDVDDAHGGDSETGRDDDDGSDSNLKEPSQKRLKSCE